MKRVRVVASGRVQGVFYRASCARLARGLGLTGYVRKPPDGRGESAVEGRRGRGVCPRARGARRARGLGLTGYVRNLPDGRVEAAFEGRDAAVDEMVAWSGGGPDLANADTLDVVVEDPLGETGFRVTRGSSGTELSPAGCAAGARATVSIDLRCSSAPCRSEASSRSPTRRSSSSLRGSRSSSDRTARASRTSSTRSAGCSASRGPV